MIKGMISILAVTAFGLFAWRAPLQALVVQEETEDVTICDKEPQMLARWDLELEDLAILRAEATALDVPFGRYLMAYFASEADEALTLEEALALEPNRLMQSIKGPQGQTLESRHAVRNFMQQARQMRQNKHQTSE